MCRIWEWSLERKAVSKLVCQISFWWFFTEKCSTIWLFSWSWRDPLKAILDSNCHSTTHEIAEKLNVSHTCIQKKKKELKQLGYIEELDLWVSRHLVSQIHLTQRISIYDSLLKRNEIDPFPKRVIIGDEKWIVYYNVNRKGSWVM